MLLRPRIGRPECLETLEEGPTFRLHQDQTTGALIAEDLKVKAKEERTRQLVLYLLNY